VERIQRTEKRKQGTPPRRGGNRIAIFTNSSRRSRGSGKSIRFQKKRNQFFFLLNPRGGIDFLLLPSPPLTGKKGRRWQASPEEKEKKEAFFAVQSPMRASLWLGRREVS
jgi:hypothetical protein